MKISKIIEEKVERDRFYPAIMVFVLLVIFFIFMRMRGVEQNYELNELIYKVNESNIDNKELKAQKARLLSVKNLREFSRRYDLKEPDQNQVIMIP